MNGRTLLHLLAGPIGDPFYGLDVWDAYGPSRLTMDYAEASAELDDPGQTVFLDRTIREAPDGEPIAWCLAAELDGPSALRCVAHMRAAPTIVHHYGDGTALALWSLKSSLQGDELARANRCLADALGVADPESAMLRAPIAALQSCDPSAAALSGGCVYAPDDVVAGDSHSRRPNARRVAALSAQRGDDPLREIPTATYVRVLAGSELPTCPLHAHAEPTLHADKLAGAETGFYCSVCEREGSIYDFAAHLWGWASPFDLTGARFYSMQRALLEVFADHYRSAAA